MAIGNPVTLTSNVASKTISAVATAGQTLFTVTGGYRLNYLAVYRNGTKLVESLDYTARDANTVTLLSPSTVGDVLEFQIFDTFRIADAVNTSDDNVNFGGSVNIQGNLNVLGITTIIATSSYGLTGSPNINVGNVVGSSATFTNITVNGTQTIINTTSLEVADKNIGIGSTSTPTDSLADGAGITIYGTTNKTLTYNNTKKGFEANIPIATNETRVITGAEKVFRTNGNTVNLVYNSSSGSNIGYTTNPSGDVTLNVTGIPTTSDFDDHSITFSVVTNSTGTARSCNAITLNGVSKTIRWIGGSYTNAIALAGFTTTNGHAIFSFTGINTVGSASTTDNYEIFGVASGGFW